MLKKLSYKDKILRQKFNKIELRSLVNKTLKRNYELYDLELKDWQSKIKPLRISKVRIRNRCIKTSRGRGIVSKFKISRIVFRQKAGEGMLPGVYKSN